MMSAFRFGRYRLPTVCTTSNTTTASTCAEYGRMYVRIRRVSTTPPRCTPRERESATRHSPVVDSRSPPRSRQPSGLSPSTKHDDRANGRSRYTAAVRSALPHGHFVHSAPSAALNQRGFIPSVPGSTNPGAPRGPNSRTSAHEWVIAEVQQRFLSTVDAHTAVLGPAANAGRSLPVVYGPGGQSVVRK